MRHLSLLILLLASPALAQTSAQPAGFALPSLSEAAPAAGDAFYVRVPRAPLYRDADSTRPIGSLSFRTDVAWGERNGRWIHVTADDGRSGWVDADLLSNVWIRVSKSQRRLYFYEGAHLVRSFVAEFGYNPTADKERRGSTLDRDAWRTPEGAFTVVRRNPNSQFYRAFVLNYPTSEDALRGLAAGLIGRAEHDAIVRAEAQHAEPPMHTALGGLIEIHGQGTGRGSNWTQGCVALTNAEMDFLWSRVQTGTPVLIEP
jgi:lipoprotein-anchoring transpeptidase ErfK/SrfK